MLCVPILRVDGQGGVCLGVMWAGVPSILSGGDIMIVGLGVGDYGKRGLGVVEGGCVWMGGGWGEIVMNGRWGRW